MNLTKKERLVLINQYKILAAIDKNDNAHYEELIEILENGYSIFYTLLDQWISDEMSTEDGKFVLEILGIYRAIEDLKRAKNTKEVIDHPMAIFPGFDGNNESEYLSFCRFLIEKQGKFQEQTKYFLQTDRLNSHCAMLDKYKRMLEASVGVNIWQMSPEQALVILNA